MNTQADGQIDRLAEIRGWERNRQTQIDKLRQPEIARVTHFDMNGAEDMTDRHYGTSDAKTGQATD